MIERQRKYAKKFCEEYPNANIKKKEDFINIRNSNKRVIRVLNGESAFGPCETWPAQVDDFIYHVSKSGNHKGKLDYQTLKEQIFLQHQEITERSYRSQEEYESTISKLFQATIIGIKQSKIESIFSRNLQKEENTTPFWKKPFTNIKENALKRNNLDSAILRFKESIPSYLNINYQLESLLK